jgi:hypothetical protein
MSIIYKIYRKEGCVGFPVPDNRKFVEEIVWIGKKRRKMALFA